MSVIKFPGPIMGTPANRGASRWSIWKTRVKEWCGSLLNHVGVPGAIQEATIDDKLTGQVVSINVGTLFTRISVNGRDYYFRRFSGKFDGTGTSLR